MRTFAVAAAILYRSWEIAILSENPRARKILQDTKEYSQRQSITQKGVHARSLTAREREHWFLQHLSHFIAVNFGRQ